MANNKNNTQNPTAETVNKKTANADAKKAMRAALDKWMAEYKTKTEAKGKTVEIKLWENFPDVVTLKVDKAVYFQAYVSKNGVRLCAKSKLIPEAVRPAGATIIKDGFDLSIPTFSDMKVLTKYANACEKSLAEAKKEKEKAAADKANKKANKDKESEPTAEPTAEK